MKHLFPIIVTFRNSPSSDVSSQQIAFETTKYLCYFYYLLLGDFPQKSYKKDLVYVHMRNFLFVSQQGSKQTKASLKNCVYLWFLPK